MDSLKAHKASSISISIHNSANLNILWINIIDHWLKLGDGNKKEEERREDLKRILPLFIERQLIVIINRELKLSYKVTKKTNIQTLLNIRTIKKQRKTGYTVKDLKFIYIKTENKIKYNDRALIKHNLTYQ